jgi:hypothetical protein
VAFGSLSSALGAGNIASVGVKLFTDANDLQRGLTQAKGDVSTASSTMTTKTSQFGKAASIAFVAAGAAAVKFGIDAVKSYNEHQVAVAKLEATIEKMPALNGATVASFEAVATSIQNLTGYQDEEVLAADAVLARFELTQDQINELMPLIADYARATGSDLPTAATNLGRALLGNTRALKTIGIEYKATGDKEQDLANITRLLEERIGGQAEAWGETLPGKMAIAGAKFDDIKEKAGGLIAQGLVPIADAIGEAVDAFLALPEPMQKMILLGGGATVTLGALGGAINLLKGGLGGLVSPIGGVVGGLALIGAGVLTFNNAVDSLSDAILTKGTPALEAWREAFAAAHEEVRVLNVDLLDAVPIFDALGGIIAERAFAQARGDVREFRDELQFLPGALDESRERLIAEKIAAGDLSTAMQLLTNWERNAREAMIARAEAEEAVNHNDERMITQAGFIQDVLRGQAEQHGKVADEAERQAQKTMDLVNAQLQLAGGFAGVAGASNSLVQSQDSLAEAQARVNELANKGKTETEEYRDAQAALDQANLQVLTSQLGLENAIIEYTVDLDKQGKSQKFVNAAVREFGEDAGLTDSAIDDLITRVTKLTGAEKDNKDASDDAAKGQENLKGDVDKTKDSAITAQGKVKLYSDAIKGIPDAAATQITANTTAAREALDALTQEAIDLGFDVGTAKSVHSGSYIGSDFPGTRRGLAHDERAAVLKVGEGVLNPEATKRLGGKAMIDAINRAPSSSMARERTLVLEFHDGGFVGADGLANAAAGADKWAAILAALAMSMPVDFTSLTAPFMGGLAGTPTGSGTPAARAWQGWAQANWPGQFGFGVTAIRYIGGTNVLSQHSYGNAVDNFSAFATMQTMANAAFASSDARSLAHLIFNRQVSSYGGPWHAYTGVSPHTDHVHADFVPQYAGDPYTGGYPIGAATGFMGWVNRRTRFEVGERGPEYVTVTPASRMAGLGEPVDRLASAVERLDRRLGNIEARVEVRSYMDSREIAYGLERVPVLMGEYD